MTLYKTLGELSTDGTSPVVIKVCASLFIYIYIYREREREREREESVCVCVCECVCVSVTTAKMYISVKCVARKEIIKCELVLLGLNVERKA